MTDRLSLALAQLNPVVGDLEGNGEKLLAAWRKAKAQGADLVIGAELCVTGYPLEDLTLRPSFLEAVEKAVEVLAKNTAQGPALLVSAPWRSKGDLYNAAILLDGGAIVATVFKRLLPNYGPFDEQRVFKAGPLPEPVAWRGRKLGVLICEDMWTPDAVAKLKDRGAEILLVPNASPFEIGKQEERLSHAKARVRETGLPLVYVNQVGGQDELVFDGASFAVGKDEVLLCRAKDWEEDLLSLVIPAKAGIPCLSRESDDNNNKASLLYPALLTGLRDYVRKNGFREVLLGLSGGIDSALVAALAVDALGAENVRGVMLPSPYTSQESLDDAAGVAKALGFRLDTIPIVSAMQSFTDALAPFFAGHETDITEENLQSRCRGIILMAMSNKFGSMLLATGNKSELATGYATLYGDMCGGYAPLKDVYKTEVYRLSRWRNAQGGLVISERVLTKAPTAELRPNQTDQDSLPPYDVLDAILEGLIENDLGLDEIAAQGYDPGLVRRVYTLLQRAEYKRRQAPPGPKITRRHSSKDRRYPMTSATKA